MESSEAMDPRYPIGRFQAPSVVDASLREILIARIASTPAALEAAVAGLDAAQIDTRYREGGWTLRQVVHHVADSHMNAYVRLKLALTQEQPTICPYDEGMWAELADARDGDVKTSLALVEVLHERWVACVRSLDEKAFSRTFVHPESGLFTLDRLLALYAWHGPHHVAQIASHRRHMGWS